MGDGTFEARNDFTTGQRPSWVAAADLDGDGTADLATPNKNFAGTVSVLLGQGDGTFGPRTDFGTGDSPTSVAIGDLNVDGRPDLVTANSGSGSYSASVLLGNGDGTFGTRIDYSTGDGPQSLAIADLNKNGELDLVTTNTGLYPGSVSVLLGNGDGTFAASTDFANTAGGAAVATADLNADTNLDVVTANHIGTGGVSVLLGNGDGTLAPSATYGSGRISSNVAVGDVDGDGRVDLVAVNRSDCGPVDPSTPSAMPCRSCSGTVTAPSGTGSISEWEERARVRSPSPT